MQLKKQNCQRVHHRFAQIQMVYSLESKILLDQSWRLTGADRLTEQAQDI